jgi:enterochelin esterase-like enzyme
MEELGLAPMLEQLYDSIQPLVCVGIHASVDRKMEYGIASQTDYLGRGAKAGAYTSFVLKELLPFIYNKFPNTHFIEKAFAGFSLGGLMAMDIVWNHSNEFNRVGVFSGSFWWRSVDQYNKEYSDDKHRIMQQEIRHGEFKPGLKFFFQCGNRDETRDRNKNGIIDSVDDTVDVIKELIAKGYDPAKDIFYIEMKDGHHDIPTWSRAMPEFLKWSWANK